MELTLWPRQENKIPEPFKLLLNDDESSLACVQLAQKVNQSVKPLNISIVFKCHDDHLTI